MTKPLYFYNGTTFEQVGPTTPQSPIAYQTSAPTGPATGDLWIDSDGDVDTYNRQLTRYYFIATAAQTTITGTDANGLTLAYVAGSEAVYVNGALQVRGQDYTATNGTSVVLSSGLAVNDVVEIFAYTAFTVANAYTKSETDGVAAAAAGLRMVVPTSVAVGSGSGSVDAIGNITFSGASSISINGCFSSTYDHYKMIITIDSISAANALQGRLRASGTDLSTTVYKRWYFLVRNAGTSGFGSDTNNVIYLNDYGTSRKDAFAVEIYNPFRTANQKYFTILDAQTESSGQGWSSSRVQVDNTTSYDGFSIIPSTGTVTGTIRVYGYKD